MSDMLAAALAYAERGWAVFPCLRDAKAPAIAGGVHMATTSPDVIRQWWGRMPEANVAVNCGLSGMVVVDLDPGCDVAELDRYDLAPSSVRARTPRGGEHWYYQLATDDEELRPSAGLLAEHVDTRSLGSYVLLPPSRVDGRPYEWEAEGRMPVRPAALADALRKGRRKALDADCWDYVDADAPENVAAYREWLEREAAPAIEGRGGDHQTFAAAAMGHSYGIAPDTCLDMLEEHYNPRCEPPWDRDELAVKRDNAYRYAENPPGNCDVTGTYQRRRSRALFDRPQLARPDADAPPPADEEQGGDGLYNVGQMAGLRPPEWLVADTLPEGAVVLLHGEPGSFKSFLALDMALSVATGEVGAWAPLRTGATLYLAGEGVRGMRQRVAAWRERTGRLALASPDDFLLRPGVPTVREGWQQWVEGTVQPALTRRPEGFALVVIDTLARAMRGTNENAQEDAGLAMEMFEALGRVLGPPGRPATILLVHHSNAAGRARGSGVFMADVDAEFEARRQGAVVRLSNPKQKDGAEWSEPRAFEAREAAESLALHPVRAAAPETRSQTSTPATTQDIASRAVLLRAIQQAFKDQPRGQWSDADFRALLRERYDLPDTTFNGHWRALVQPEEPLHAHHTRRRWYADPEASADQGGRPATTGADNIAEVAGAILAARPGASLSTRDLARMVAHDTGSSEATARRHLQAMANHSPLYGKSGWRAL